MVDGRDPPPELLGEVHRILNVRGSGRTACQMCDRDGGSQSLSETEEKLRKLQRFASALKDNLSRWQKMSDKSVWQASFAN
jgi:hypothetical protein